MWPRLQQFRDRSFEEKRCISIYYKNQRYRIFSEIALHNRQFSGSAIPVFGGIFERCVRGQCGRWSSAGTARAPQRARLPPPTYTHPIPPVACVARARGDVAAAPRRERPGRRGFSAARARASERARARASWRASERAGERGDVGHRGRRARCCEQVRRGGRARAAARAAAARRIGDGAARGAATMRTAGGARPDGERAGVARVARWPASRGDAAQAHAHAERARFAEGCGRAQLPGAPHGAGELSAWCGRPRLG